MSVWSPYPRRSTKQMACSQESIGRLLLSNDPEQRFPQPSLVATVDRPEHPHRGDSFGEILLRILDDVQEEIADPRVSRMPEESVQLVVSERSGAAVGQEGVLRRRRYRKNHSTTLPNTLEISLCPFTANP